MLRNQDLSCGYTAITTYLWQNKNKPTNQSSFKLKHHGKMEYVWGEGLKFLPADVKMSVTKQK